MLELRLDKYQYAKISVSERALRIVATKLEGWFGALSEYEQLEKIRKNSILKQDAIS